MSAQDLHKEIANLQTEIRRLQKNNLGLVFEDKQEDVVIECTKNVPVLREVIEKRVVGEKAHNNILIEGDNYHALSVLNYTHKKSIDLIYIDPPYNTGAKNWKYNNDYVDKEDEYRHSKWLSFMRHRLELAKNLLKDDGVLICAIDENEQAHLSVLLEMMFPSYDQHTVTIIHNPRGVQGKNFSYTHEYALFLLPKNREVIGLKQRQALSKANLNLRDKGNESERKNAKNCFYPFLIKNEQIVGIGEVPPNDFHPSAKIVQRKDGSYEVWPIDVRGVERKWRYANQSVESVMDILKVKKNSQTDFDIEIHKMHEHYRTVWDDPKYNASLYGTKLLRDILHDCDFDFPKSLHLVEECLYAVVGSKKNATVLDFFAGSGTTGHAILEMNKKDDGDRTFILCTNNENNNEGMGGIAESVCYPRIKAVIEGYTTKKGEYVPGIDSSLHYYKTDMTDVEHLHKMSDETKIRIAYQAGEMIAVREGTLQELEKNEWWQLFEGKEKLTAIYFKEDKSKLHELITKLEKKKFPAVLYIFSWGKNEYTSEYSSANIRVEDIPEPIIEVYKEINQL